MEIATLRPEFVVYAMDEDQSIAGTLKEILSGARYQVEIFQSADALLAKIKEAPPHIVYSGKTDVSLLSEIKKLSGDIEFVSMVTKDQKSQGVEFLRLGAFAYIEKPFTNFSEVVTLTDRIIENIYLRMENEQLIEEMAQKAGGTNSGVRSDFVETFVRKTAVLEDPDKVVQALIEEISQIFKSMPVIFLKFQPIYQSLIVSASVQIPLDNIRNVGIKLDRYDPRNIPLLLSEPDKFNELRELMIEVFKCPTFYAAPLAVEGTPVGIIVIFSTIDPEKFRSLATMITIGALTYNSALLSNRLKDLAIRDSLTGIYNRRYFNEKIEEEMNRSRRTHYPLSLIQIDIDHFKNYNDTNGHIMGDLIIKTVAQVIAKTSRKTDIVVRMGGDEFAIMCPATPAVGAAVKAEKIRLTLEGTKFPQGESQPTGKVTVSIGVSAYPTIVNDSLTLVRAADDALYKVRQGGRNRVCLAEAPAGFKPEFEPLPVPGFQALPGSSPNPPV